MDDFVGKTFDTPKGGIITVTGGLPKKKGIPRGYSCSCSICSADIELFPLIFKTTKHKLSVSGSLPCGCTSYKWSESQQVVRVERECKKRGYAFLGWKGDEYKSNNTKIILHNPVTGNTWSTTNIARFLRGSRDPVESSISGKLLRMKTDKEFIIGFIKAGFSPKDIFKRDENFLNGIGSAGWEFTCHKCSVDQYSKAGLCSGTFKTSTDALTQGTFPCRCNKSRHLTKEQQEYRIQCICDDEGLTWVGWCEEGYTGNHSKFKWVCNGGHLKDTTTISNFVHKGTRCRECHFLFNSNNHNSNGYYYAREKEQDYLYLMDCTVSIKVGRSFDIPRRKNEIKNIAKLSQSPEVIQSYTASHNVIYSIEQDLHYELRVHGYQYNCDWTNECFTKDCWGLLQNLLGTYVVNGVIKECNNKRSL